MFQRSIEAATQMQALSVVDSRPNCLIIDEIDGAPTVSSTHTICIHTYQQYYMCTQQLEIRITTLVSHSLKVVIDYVSLTSPLKVDSKFVLANSIWSAKSLKMVKKWPTVISSSAQLVHITAVVYGGHTQSVGCDLILLTALTGGLTVLLEYFSGFQSHWMGLVSPVYIICPLYIRGGMYRG